MHPLYEQIETSVFERMSLAAAKHGAVNLGQGFPDFGWPPEILEAAARAVVCSLLCSALLLRCRDAIGRWQRMRMEGAKGDSGTEERGQPTRGGGAAWAEQRSNRRRREPFDPGCALENPAGSQRILARHGSK